MNEQAIIAKAEAVLRIEAREHKHLEFAHRRSAKRLHQAADELAAALRELGIAMIVQPPEGTDRKESKPCLMNESST